MYIYICISLSLSLCQTRHLAGMQQSSDRSVQCTPARTHLSWWFRVICALLPEGPSTQDLRTLAPNHIPLIAFGTRVLKYWVLGPSGSVIKSCRNLAPCHGDMLSLSPWHGAKSVPRLLDPQTMYPLPVPCKPYPPKAHEGLLRASDPKAYAAV